MKSWVGGYGWLIHLALVGRVLSGCPGGDSGDSSRFVNLSSGVDGVLDAAVQQVRNLSMCALCVLRFDFDKAGNLKQI